MTPMALFFASALGWYVVWLVSHMCPSRWSAGDKVWFILVFGALFYMTLILTHNG